MKATSLVVCCVVMFLAACSVETKLEPAPPTATIVVPDWPPAEGEHMVFEPPESLVYSTDTIWCGAVTPLPWWIHYGDHLITEYTPHGYGTQVFHDGSGVTRYRGTWTDPERIVDYTLLIVLLKDGAGQFEDWDPDPGFPVYQGVLMNNTCVQEWRGYIARRRPQAL